MTRERITVVSRYLCGADGAHSTVADVLQLPFNDPLGGGLALNVVCEADMVNRVVSLSLSLKIITSSDPSSRPFSRPDSRAAQTRQAAARPLLLRHSSSCQAFY
jgi:2-polyprenyl-6-methoxyphenol hydroxylase-like FAD-dependent oxidoreductase